MHRIESKIRIHDVIIKHEWTETWMEFRLGDFEINSDDGEKSMRL